MKKIDKFFKLIVSLVIFFIILPPMLSFFVLNLSNLNKRNVIKQKVINASRMPYMHTRNIWQSHCTIYDEILLYYPKNGECEFNNIEFKTKTNFNNGIRLDNLSYDKNKYNILVLGDSIAMGWGVNDDKTFAYLIEDQLLVNVDNYSVSSYGTVREMQVYEKINKKYDLIILQYNNNDYYENVSFFLNEITYPRPKKLFNFLSQKPKNTLQLYTNYLVQLYNWFYIQPIKRRIFKSEHKNIEEVINYEKVMNRLFKKYFLDKNIDSKVIFLPISGTGKGVADEPRAFFENTQTLKNFYFLNIKFDKNKHFYKLDDHPNNIGHKFIAEKLIDYIYKKKIINF